MSIREGFKIFEPFPNKNNVISLSKATHSYCQSEHSNILIISGERTEAQAQAVCPLTCRLCTLIGQLRAILYLSLSDFTLNIL